MSELAFADRDYAYARPRNSTGARSSDRARGLDKILSAFKVLLPVAILVVVCVAGFVFLLLPGTKISHINSVGATTMEAGELASWAGLPEGANWFSVDCDAVARNLEAHPRVARASVERRFPDTLVLSITERIPVALVYVVSSTGRTEAHCVDADGVVFASASLYPGAAVLPILSGLEIRGLWYGLRLEGPFTDLLASLSVVRASEPALVSALSELRVVVKNGAPAELLVYTTRYRIPVRMQAVLDAGLLKSMLLVLDVVESEGLSPSIKELDLRSDTFVYRTKEAVSG